MDREHLASRYFFIAGYQFCPPQRRSAAGEKCPCYPDLPPLVAAQENLRLEQKTVMEMNYLVMNRVLSPIQSALFVVEAYPTRPDALALSNIAAQVRVWGEGVRRECSATLLHSGCLMSEEFTLAAHSTLCTSVVPGIRAPCPEVMHMR